MIYIQELSKANLIDALKVGFKFWTETPVFNKYKWDNEVVYSHFESFIDSDTKCGYVAYKDDEAIGILLGYVEGMFWTKLKSLQLSVLYVTPEERGNKSGFRLIDEWMKFGKRNKVDDVFFKVNSGIGMKKNMKFLNSLGFETIGFEMRREL